MSWRSTQLGNNNCDQDKLILDLFKNKPVHYIGNDTGFASRLNLDPTSEHAVAIFNHTGWLSELVEFIQDLKEYKSFYLGINRYCVLGNNTDIEFDEHADGQNLVVLVQSILSHYSTYKSGTFDDDQGKYFNFVQPLTWVYGTN